MIWRITRSSRKKIYLKTAKDKFEKAKLKRQIQSLEHRIQHKKERREFQAEKSKIMKEEMRKVQGGLKKRFYLKESKWQEVEDIVQYERLKNEGGKDKVEKFLAKRQRKKRRKAEAA